MLENRIKVRIGVVMINLVFSRNLSFIWVIFKIIFMNNYVEYKNFN